MYLFFMMPVLFLDTVSNLVAPLTKLAHAVALLIGRSITERERRVRGWQTCHHHVRIADKRATEVMIPESLSEFSKVTPGSAKKSHVHQVVHYPRSVDAFGSLSSGWMFGDERRNKVSYTSNPQP